MKLLWTTILMAFSCTLTAQDLNAGSSGRAMGLGHATATLQDAWSPWQNIAGSAYASDNSVAAGYSNRFLVKELQLLQITTTIPTNAGSFSLASSFFGFELYNRSSFALGYARAWQERLATGLQFRYHREFVSESGHNPNYFSFSAGLQANPLKRLHFGLVYHQFIGSEHSWQNHQELRLGLQYRFNSEFRLMTDAIKKDSQDLKLALAAEYRFVEVLALRAAISSEPFSSHYGVGLYLQQLQIHLGYEYLNSAGNNLAASLQYTF